MKKFKKISLPFLLALILMLVACNEEIEPMPIPNNETPESNIDDKEDVSDTDIEDAVNTINDDTDANNNTDDIVVNDDADVNNSIFDGYTFIEVDGGDLSGNRQANVVVDIGFGDREYYAFTNEHGQLVKVTADEIILQDESTEPVNSKGRYYDDEAKVPGTEAKDLDEGHVIADSLGGVANAYNITPQNSTLNRHGNQAYMEKVIRDAGGCTDFIAIITYPDTETQIPNHYSYTYTLNGNVINDEFDNVNPDKTTENNNTESENEGNASISEQAKITKLDKQAEYIIIQNTSDTALDMTGWKILSVTGNQQFIFPTFILDANATVKVGDSGKNNDVDFHWMKGRGIWNNSKSDPAELYNNKGDLIAVYDD